MRLIPVLSSEPSCRDNRSKKAKAVSFCRSPPLDHPRSCFAIIRPDYTSPEQNSIFITETHTEMVGHQPLKLPNGADPYNKDIFGGVRRPRVYWPRRCGSHSLKNWHLAEALLLVIILYHKVTTSLFWRHRLLLRPTCKNVNLKTVNTFLCSAFRMFTSFVSQTLDADVERAIQSGE